MVTEAREAKERFTITLPGSLKAEIEAAVPERQRSKFAAEALREALKAKAIREALAMTRDLPKVDTKGEDSVEVLRRHRGQFAARYAPKDE